MDFADLSLDDLNAVAEYAYSADSDVTFVDEDYRDLAAPHGANTPEEKTHAE